jgi:AcrR family transcriptional regulator
MDKMELRRAALIRQLAEFVLANGLGQASLRPMARAAGTSDRMLLYYFRDKAELLEAVLGAIVAELYAEIEAVLPGEDRLQPCEVFERLGSLVARAGLQPYMRLWSELSAAAGRGEAPVAPIAERIAEGFAAFAEARLDVADPDERRELAALLLVQIDGAALLEPFAGGAYSRAAHRAIVRLLTSM